MTALNLPARLFSSACQGLAAAATKIAAAIAAVAIAVSLTSGSAAAAEMPSSAALSSDASINDADAWVMVARSEDGVQYVAPDSVQPTAVGVRLKSYWQHRLADGTPETVRYMTEYDCQGRYRDVETAGPPKAANPKDTNWKWIGADLLNRGAMEYGCARRGGS